MFCQNCGNELHEQAIICPKCGMPTLNYYQQSKCTSEINGFAIAGADGKFVWANAVIEKDTVVVSSPKVISPKYVRYAYVGYRGDCNLQNKEGLPAYPFTSLANQYSDAK